VYEVIADPAIHLRNYVRKLPCPTLLKDEFVRHIDLTCIAFHGKEGRRHDLHNELHPRNEFVVELQTNSDLQGKRREVLTMWIHSFILSRRQNKLYNRAGAATPLTMIRFEDRALQ